VVAIRCVSRTGGHGGPPVQLILALLLCFTTLHAQETNQKPQREKAIGLLQSLATQLSTLQSAENRARLGANIADSLWPHDEKRARALFINIAEDIRWGIYDREINHPRDEHVSMVFMQLRTDTLARIAKHDAELAFDFLKATAPSYENQPRSVIARERDLEVKLAQKIAVNNPDLALKIGRQSLSRGFSDELLPLLKQLHKKHREQGVALYKDTIRKFRDVDFTDNPNTVYFARYLTEDLTPPLADDAAYRELISIFNSAALANKCGKANEVYAASNFCEQIREVLAEAHSKRSNQALDRRIPTFDGPPLSALEEILVNDGDVDDILALAQKYPEMEAAIYWQAATKAHADGNTELARKIANDHITDPEERQRLLANFDASEGVASISDEKLAEIQTEINQITRVEERIGYLAHVANRIGAKNRATALKLLDQAAGMLESVKPGKTRVLIQLGLALLYCVEKSDRGFAIIESMLPRLNEMIDAAVKLDGFDTHYMRDGEWNMSADGSLGELLTFMAQDAASYAWCDFDRAVGLAAQFERTEIRMMAQVKLAQAILAGPPKRFSIMNGLLRR